MPLIDGGTQRLPRIVGLGRALDLILTGRIVEADEALAMGLLTEIVPEGGHLDRALEIAEALARFPQETMLADRAAAIEGIGMTVRRGDEARGASRARSRSAWRPRAPRASPAARAAAARARGPRRGRCPSRTWRRSAAVYAR